ncbi:hypothetical protein [Prevotella pallens]|uniref:hypothetical protein n=1 Tax=Prevotella pallens TaxID=60133 RepID=UPI001CAB667E|nr:hypothetical protein [Prevotella pallens]MBF1464220.1 hypothetical protein [Prevotella pallens]MBF1486986.1 hypothetical protein [Prevotella pallens]
MATNIPQYSFFAQMYGSKHTERLICQFIAPYHNQKQLVLMYEIWRICDTNNTNRTSGK